MSLGVADAEAWIRTHVAPVAAIETAPPATIVDGTVGAARRRDCLVQGVRGRAGVRAAADSRLVRTLARPRSGGDVTFRFLEQLNRLAPTDRWFWRLRDAYLEPWGTDLAASFALAIRVGAFAAGRVATTARPPAGVGTTKLR